MKRILLVGAWLLSGLAVGGFLNAADNHMFCSKASRWYFPPAKACGGTWPFVPLGLFIVAGPVGLLAGGIVYEISYSEDYAGWSLAKGEYER